MTLLTQYEIDKLLFNSLPENKGNDHLPAVKLYLPNTRFVCLFTALDPQNKFLAFGLVNLGIGNPGLGFIDLNIVRKLRNPVFQRVRRDDCFIPIFPISVYALAARHEGYITEDHTTLKYYAPSGMKSLWPEN